MSGDRGEVTERVKSYHNETSELKAKIDQLREAILQIAKETGVKLKVEL